MPNAAFSVREPSSGHVQWDAALSVVPVGQPRTADTARFTRRKGVPETNIKTIARGACYVGALLLLFTLASGYSLSSSEADAAAAVMRNHSIPGLLGTILCIAGTGMLLRLK
ncbi:MAG: hypothetical protein GX600_10230 [Dehalococcoidia bacterium]|nr:hypothetical protein [Dehalococcoidia bacterium]